MSHDLLLGAQRETYQARVLSACREDARLGMPVAEQELLSQIDELRSRQLYSLLKHPLPIFFQ